MEKWNAFVGYIGGLKDSLMEKWDNFTQGISDMVDYVSTLGSRIWDSIKSAFGSIGDYISDIFKRIYNGFVDKFGKYIGMEKVALSSDKATMTEPKSIEGEAQKAEIPEEKKKYFSGTDKADQTGNAKALKEAGDTNTANSSNNVGITQDNKQIITTNNAESQFVGSGNRNPDPASKWERLTATT
jgi:phage-related protein